MFGLWAVMDHTEYNGSNVDFNKNKTALDVNNDFIASVLPVSIVLILFTIVGVVGNIFVLYVHLFKYQKCNFRYFVLGLCAIDLTSSLTILPLEVFTQLNWYVFPSAWLCKASAFMHMFFSSCSVYVLLLVAIDRYRKVCAPYKWQITPTLVLKGYALCFFLSCCQSWTALFAYGLGKHSYNYEGQRIDVHVCTTDPHSEGTDWPTIYTFMVIPILIAMIAMMIIYAYVGTRIFAMVREMRRKSKRQKQTIRRHRQDQTTEHCFGDNNSTNDFDTESIMNSNIRHEIEDTLQTNNTDVDLVAYKVKGDGIMYEKRRSCRRSTNNVRMTFEEKKNREEKKSKIFMQKSASSSIEDNKSSSISNNSDNDGKDSKKCKSISIVRDSRVQECLKHVEEDYATSNHNTKKWPMVKKLSMGALFKKKISFSLSARGKLKRRTLITFVFTAIFIVTTVIYISISRAVVNHTNTHSMSHETITVLLFFYRLYLINNVIHPIIYGMLDPRFRKTLRRASRSVMDTVRKSHIG